MSKYNVDLDQKASDMDVHSRAVERLDKITKDYDKLDEQNPIEQKHKVDIIKKNPPKPGSYDISLYRAEDKETGQNYLVSSTDSPYAKRKVIIRNPLFSIDFNAAVQGNITKTPGAVVPMLLDMANEKGLRMDETFCNEKDRKVNLNLSMILIIILGVLMFGGGVWVLLTKFFGG